MVTQTTDLRQRITDEITEGIRNGAPIWKRPWAGGDNGRPANAVSRNPYSGVNIFALWALARERGYSSRYWATYRQWAELGGQVRRRPDDIPQGGWGCRIVYFKEVSRTRDTDEGERDDKYKLLRSYTVFNLDQVDGVALDHLRYKPETRPAIPNYEPAEHAIQATGADIRFGGDRAFYSRTEDYIQMPHRPDFPQVHEFYATSFHELGHWSERRLKWAGSYALGELIAEMSSAFVCSELGVPHSDDMTNHTAYVGAWLKEIEGDPQVLLRAAAQASRVCDFLLSFSRPVETNHNAA